MESNVKRIYSHIAFGCLLAVLCLACADAYAQTYRDGTWYSLYDESEHTMNTQGDYETGDVFAPTQGTLNVQWRYEWIDWLGIARKIDTDVLESADSGGSTSEVGSLAENTDKNSHTTEAFTVSRDINWIKFNRSGVPTHKVILYHLDIALAPHILLADGTYGATSKSYDFGEVDVLTSAAGTIALRSFLSAGDITVHSSDPEIFHLGSADNTGDLTYAVGANACASANGTANAAAGGSLGKIDNYAVTVYFTPREGKEYSATITLSDGVSTAKVMVGGIGRRLTQTITWEPEPQILSNAAIPAAEASSGLEVAYAFAPEGILAVENGVLAVVGEGEVTVTASQEGNAIYEAAEPVVRTVTVVPALTRSEYNASVCEGESYSDAHFEGLAEAGLYYDTIPNRYGGDSVICLTLTLNPVYAFEQTDTVYHGAPGLWQDIDLSVLPAGDTTLIVRYSTVTGCDSAYILHLTVLQPTTYGAYEAAFCAGDSILFEDVWYAESVETDVLLGETNQYGGDSVVRLTVTVHPVYAFDEHMTLYLRDEASWQGIDLSGMPVGDTTLTAAYTTVNGCDSVYTLTLTVLRPLVTTYGNDTINLCAGESAVYEGKTYRRPAKDSVLLSIPNQYGGDSIVELVVNVLPAMRMKASMTIYEGDKIVWQDIDLSVLPVGDTTLTVTYTSVNGCDSTYILYLEVITKTQTALDNTDCVKGKPHKFFRNGQMYIRKHGQVYNLQGVKIKED
jgi:hypothetical protein